MAKNIMQGGKRKKSKENERFHEVVGDASGGAKIWPESAVEEEEDENEVLGQHHSTNALAAIGVMIDFAEAFQNASTLYGVSAVELSYSVS